MDQALISAVIVAVSAVLNRVRGDDSWKPEWLKGRALFYVVPLIGLLAWSQHDPVSAVIIAAGYFFWAVFDWGFVLGRVGGWVPPREPGPVDAVLMKMPGTTLPLFVRQLFVLPGVAGLVYWVENPTIWFAAPIFAGVACVIYRVLFRSMSGYDWMRAEVAMGALWGVFIVFI